MIVYTYNVLDLYWKTEFLGAIKYWWKAKPWDARCDWKVNYKQGIVTMEWLSRLRVSLASSIKMHCLLYKYIYVWLINMSENWRAIKKGKYRKKWQHWVHKTQYIQTNQQKEKHITICVWHYYTQTNTNDIIKTWIILQTIPVKDEPNIVFIRKS